MDSQQNQQSVQSVQANLLPNTVKQDGFNWGKVLLIVLGCLAIAGVGSGGYLLGKNSNNSFQSLQKVNAIPTNSPAGEMKPTIIVSPTMDTTNWKTYSPSDNSYRVKYPNDPNWKPTEVKGSYYADIDIQCSHVGCPQSYNVYDFAGGTSTTLQTTIDEYLQSLNTTNPSINTQASPYILDYQKIKIDGLDAVETLAQTSKLASSGPIVRIFVVNKGHGYSFGYTYTDVVVNTITKLNQLPKPNPDFVSTLQFSQ